MPREYPESFYEYQGQTHACEGENCPGVEHRATVSTRTGPVKHRATVNIINHNPKHDENTLRNPLSLFE